MKRLLQALCAVFLAAQASAQPQTESTATGAADAAGIIDGLARAGPVPAVIADGIAPVAPANTRRDPATGSVEVFVQPDPGRAALPVVDPRSDAAQDGMLRRLAQAGNLAGLADVIYDNRDSDHSVLRAEAFPQVSRSRYDAAFKAERLHHGPAGRVLFSLPVVGNSSTAMTLGPLARSLARLALADQASALRAFRLYASNHLYVYPEHRDFDVETGDRLFAPVPYFVVSQGSSYRDQPFVEALLAITAAYRADTRARLVELGLLAPATQMVLRRTLVGVNTQADYLSPRAHPPVFRPDLLRPAAAVALAHAMSPDAIPPMVRLSVQRDFTAQPGRDYLASNLGEVLFTTPSALARLWRSFAHTREMTVSAAGTRDPNGRPLRFHWVVLQGDPARIRIVPRGADGAVADIAIDWHDSFVSQPATGMTSARVDIGVIADNGVALSAPATISVLFPVHQDRVYGGAGDRPLLQTLRYAPDTGDSIYVDPTLWPVADWQDALSHDAEGRITRITRRGPDGGRQEVLRPEADGWTAGTRASADTVRHVARSSGKGRLELTADRAPRAQ